MTKLLNEVVERMEEEELLGVIGRAAIKAFLTITGLFLVGYYVLPFFATGKPTTFAVAFVATYLTMVYVFVDTTERRDWGVMTAFGFGAFGYAAVLYIFGELIVIGLIFLGIAIVVSFIAGDGFLTALYTYLDLRKWVSDEIETEKIAQLKEQGAVADD